MRRVARGPTTATAARSSSASSRAPTRPGWPRSSRLPSTGAVCSSTIRPACTARWPTPAGEVEERSWLAFLIAYLCPLEEDGPVRRDRARPHVLGLGRAAGARRGPLRPPTAHDPARGARTLEAYRDLGRSRRLAVRRVHRRRGVDAGAAVRPCVRAARAARPASRRAVRSARDAGPARRVRPAGGLAGAWRRERRHRGGQARVRDRRSAAARAPGVRPGAGVRSCARGARPRPAQLAARRARHARAGPREPSPTRRRSASVQAALGL